tara:strand:- start:667 stop:1173 length:507 start_codon:yes stop_codon:yes gene_type:complete
MTSLSYRPAKTSDAKAISLMRNDLDTLLCLKDVNQYSEDQTIEWIKSLPASSKRIVVSSGENFVGLIRIDNIDSVNANCMIGLDIDKSYRGKGLATQIYRWLLDYLFYQYNMHTIYLEVLDTNAVAIRVYEKLGMTIDGRLRERIYRNGKYEDYLYMSILRGEYNDNS